jgi:hypothetical protein
MVVETRARGTLPRLCIQKDDLLSAGRDLEGIDLPIEEEACPPEMSGTTITLSDLNQNLLFPPKLLKRIYGKLQADGLANDTTADWGAIIENSQGYQQVSEGVRNQLSAKYGLQ